jgi:hypothetical protein
MVDASSAGCGGAFRSNPAVLTENMGQWDARVSFHVHGANEAMWLAEHPIQPTMSERFAPAVAEPGDDALKRSDPEHGSAALLAPVAAPNAEVAGVQASGVSVSASSRYTCALTAACGVKCWGQNYYGELGDGTKTRRSAPVVYV